MNLRVIIRKIQKIVGVKQDGIFGPVSAMAVLSHLRVKPLEVVETDAEFIEFDKRTEHNLRTLSPKAQRVFRPFIARAKAIAATMGCEYRGICGSRTYAQQDNLYQIGRRGIKGEHPVTRARGGFSWHNFNVAMDFGVFDDAGRYIDNDDPSVARRVHAAIGQVAAEYGIKWGGNWQRFKDAPHFQVETSLTLGKARKLHAAGKEVL